MSQCNVHNKLQYLWKMFVYRLMVLTVLVTEDCMALRTREDYYPYSMREQALDIVKQNRIQKHHLAPRSSGRRLLVRYQFSVVDIVILENSFTQTILLIPTQRNENKDIILPDLDLNRRKVLKKKVKKSR